MILKWSWFCPPGTFGNVWGHSCLWQPGGWRVIAASGGWRPGMLLTSHHALDGLLKQRLTQPKTSIMPKFKSPSLVCKSHKHTHTSDYSTGVCVCVCMCASIYIFLLHAPIVVGLSPSVICRWPLSPCPLCFCSLHLIARGLPLFCFDFLFHTGQGIGEAKHHLNPLSCSVTLPK